MSWTHLYSCLLSLSVEVMLLLLQSYVCFLLSLDSLVSKLFSGVYDQGGKIVMFIFQPVSIRETTISKW